MSEVKQVTADYEQWLGAQIPLVAAELDAKHAEMKAHEYRFLRGSYYLWLVRVGAMLPDALALTPVPLVGDLHVENFGTWRDVEQVRRWGVNDLDELASGPWFLDLLRLATSAVLAPHITLPGKDICEVLLDAWATTTPRPAIDLAEEGSGHLRRLVPPFADPRKFYANLARGEPAELPAAVAAVARGVAEEGWTPTWHVHEAGTGSLGHRRVVGVGPAADGAMHAREAKQLGPGTAEWAASRGSARGLSASDASLYELVRLSLRGPAAAARVDGWQVRDLAPDVVRIELTGLAHHDSERLLRAMARATADVHGSHGHAFGAAVAEARRLPESTFRDAVDTMVESTKQDFADYR